MGRPLANPGGAKAVTLGQAIDAIRQAPLPAVISRRVQVEKRGTLRDLY